MDRKGHRSLNHLQIHMTKELRKLKINKKSHHKMSSSFSCDSLKKQQKLITKSVKKSFIFAKQSSQKKNLISSGSANMVNFNEKILKKRNDHNKGEKLKKKGCRKQKQDKCFEMSFASTKCTDSKVYEAKHLLTLPQLLKQNSEYQKIISNQRAMIANLQNIIDQM